MKYKIKRKSINAPFVHLFETDYKPYKWNIYYGGTGSGKSVAISRALVKYALENNNSNWMVARKIHASMDKTVVLEFLDGCDGALVWFKLIKDVDYKYNKKEDIITFNNGSKIFFVGYDDPEKVKGIKNVWGIWLEEATDFAVDDYGKAKDRLRGSLPKNFPWEHKPVFMSFNPVNVDHNIRRLFFKDKIDKSNKIWKDYAKDEKLTKVVKVTWRDNMYYGDDNYADEDTSKQKHEMNPRLAEVEDYGNWGTLGELIYENIKIISREEIDKIEFDQISYGCDFGYRHNSAVCRVGLKDNNIYITDEIYQNELKTSELIESINEKFPKFYEVMYCDCAYPASVVEMYDSGLNVESCKKGTGSVLSGIKWMQDRIIYICEDCIGGIGESNKYTWMIDKMSGRKIPKPIKINDDMMDSIRYATQGFKEIDYWG